MNVEPGYFNVFCFPVPGGPTDTLYDDDSRRDGFGPLFFSLGLDELLTAVREAMRDVTVGQVLHVVGNLH